MNPPAAAGQNPGRNVSAAGALVGSVATRSVAGVLRESLAIDPADTSSDELSRDPLRTLARAAAAAPGDERLASIVRGMAELLHADTAYVSAVLPRDREQARIVALWDHGAAGEPLHYALRDTPCEPVLTTGRLFVERGVAARFANDPWFADRADSGYMGLRLEDAEGAPLGVLGVLSDGPLPVDEPGARALLEVFARLAASELERATLLERLEAGRAPSATARRDAHDAPPAPGFPVIVLDADEQVCRVLRGCLAAAGHDPLCLDTAEQLRRVAPEVGPGLALLEADFPRLDVRATCAWLAEHAPELRRVLLDGGADDDGVDAVALGAHERLGKPFAPARLLELVEEFRASRGGAPT